MKVGLNLGSCPHQPHPLPAPPEMGSGGASHLDGVQGQLYDRTLLWGQALGFLSYHVVLDEQREGPGGQSRPPLGICLFVLNPVKP